MDIIRFDHAVLLMNDERRARPFYLETLGATLDHDFVRSRDGHDYHRSFLNLSNGHGIGLFEDRIPVPEPRGVRDYPAVVFRVPPSALEAAVSSFEDENRPMSREKLGLPGTGETVYVQDTEGNAIGLTFGGDDAATLARLELDVSDLDKGIAFYQDVFGLEKVESGILPGRQPYAWFPIESENQGLLLVEDEDAPGKNPGQHYAFLIGRAAHLEAKERLKSLGVPELRGHEGPRPDGEIGTYVADPWGRKLQWITNPDTP